MDIPAAKNRRWAAGVYKGIDRLDKGMKAAVMRPAGSDCAMDILALCEKDLGKRIETVDDLVAGWNMMRERRNLAGKWELRGNTVQGVFNECGCPLVRSGLIELHSLHCYCSQGMMETIFSRVSKKAAVVEIKRAIGRGDEACEFVITL